MKSLGILFDRVKILYFFFTFLYYIKIMKILISKISDKGQTTVPKAIRKTLKVVPGDLIKYEIREGTVKIKKLEAEESTWLKSIESTLEEWQGSQDDDL